MIRILLFLFIFYFTFPQTIVKIVLPKSESDVRYSYYLDLLKLSLDKTSSKYGSYKFETEFADVTRQRLATYLADGSPYVDVIWTGTNIQREEIMLPVRIPLLKGLKGYRLLIINKDREKEFDKIDSINDLKKLIAVQGVDWPDKDILLANGFKIETNPNYNGMFLMVENKRVDYFPRAINEPFEELRLRPDLNLTIAKKVMIYYPLPNYFFVNIKKPELRNRVEEGLNIAIKDGSFDKIFYNHPSNKELFQKVNFKNMKIFKVENPYLTQETKKIMNDKKYIFNPK